MSEEKTVDGLMTAIQAYATALAARPSDAAIEVLAERRRQIEKEGWTPEHDDEHAGGSMAAAAGCYALYADAYPNTGQPPASWPWVAECWNPKDRRRNLVRAGALILAEIERLDRLAARGGTK